MSGPVRIKLCGLTRPEDIRAANAAGADYIGFVFAEKSRRFVSPAAAAQLKALMDEHIQAVGVFVNAPLEQVAGLLAAGTIDVAQLHGSEDGAYLTALRQCTDKPIIQAFRVDSPADVAQAVRSRADFLLLDNGPGGTGRRFDWSLVKGVTRPFFLAGGLCPENVAEAVRTVHPYAVDVSSGIETGGVKDAAKMQAFVRAVRQAER